MNKIFELCKNLSKLTHIDNVYIIVITEIIISYLFIRIIRFIITKIGASLIKDSRKKYLYHKKINVFSSLIFVISFEPEIEFKIIFRAGDTHALSTSAGGGFDHNRITDFVCKLFAGLYVIDWIFRTWNDRNSGLHHCLSGVGFISHAVDNICTWSDKCNTVFFAQTYKV